MYAHAGELNARQEQAAQLRSKGQPWNTVAEQTGYSPKHIRNLAQLPAFDRRVQELTDACIADALNLLKRNAVRAAEVVIELLAPPDISTVAGSKANEVRLNAATDTLNRLGVSVEKDHTAPSIDLTIGIDLSGIDAAEAAFVAALRAQSAAVGNALYAGQSSGAWNGALLALPVPGGAATGPPSGADDSESAANGHESGGGA